MFHTASRALCALVLTASFAQAQSFTTSEEDPPIDCGDRIITDLSCEGRFCDNVTATCGGPSRGARAIEWSDRISEERGKGGCFFSEGRGEVPIPEGKWAGVISGLSCGGHYCDDIFLRCTLPEGVTPGVRVDCSWTSWVTDDPDTGAGQVSETSFPEGYAATGMECRGSNCDDKRFYVCRLRER